MIFSDFSKDTWCISPSITWNLYFPTKKSIEPLRLTCNKSLLPQRTFTWTHQICAHICTISSNNEEIGEFFLHRSFADNIFGRITSVVKRKDSKTSKPRCRERFVGSTSWGPGLFFGGWYMNRVNHVVTIATGSYRDMCIKKAQMTRFPLWYYETLEVFDSLHDSWFVLTLPS